MRIGRTFVLAAKPVTVREFRQFLKENKENKLETWFEQNDYAASRMKRYAPDDDCPAILVDWYMAAAYCNWLSQQDGIPEDQWCYETNAETLPRQKVSVFVSLLVPLHPLARAASTGYFFSLMDQQPQASALKKGYLSLRGYRLPTEAEMEYATRAGTVTARYYGETDELLPKYAWYNKNGQEKTWPVGSLKPNDLGLFDAQGNVWTWCQDKGYPEGNKATDDTEDDFLVKSTDMRMTRGGSYDYQPSHIRSAQRNPSVVTNGFGDYGFRPARTLRLGSFPALPPTAKVDRK